MRLFSRHLDLAALYASLAGETRPSTDAHLTACARCRAAQQRLGEHLGAIAVGAGTDADRAFPPEVLARQRDTIRQRIGRVGIGGRLLPFPLASAQRPAGRRADRSWIAAAAVAGLLVGVALGRLDLGWADLAGGPSLATLEGAQRATGGALVPEPWRDDPLLSDVDALLTRETRPEFEALDGLTPISDEAR